MAHAEEVQGGPEHLLGPADYAVLGTRSLTYTLTLFRLVDVDTTQLLG